jgi:hypothetical protein
MVRLNIPKKPPKLDELHQLVVVIPGVESPGLRLHQCRRAPAQVLLPLSKLNRFLPQRHVKVEDELAAVGVSLYLVEVLLPSSLVLGPLLVKSGTGLGEGFVGNSCLLLPRGEGFLPLCELTLPRKELLNHHSQRPRHSTARRCRRKWSA